MTIPGAIAAFALDLSFTTTLQLRLAHDLAVIYGVPVDLDDPEDVWEIMDVDQLLAAVTAVSDTDTKKVIYESACRTAGVDREFAAKEIVALRQLAVACGVDFDEKALKDFMLR